MNGSFGRSKEGSQHCPGQGQRGIPRHLGPVDVARSLKDRLPRRVVGVLGHVFLHPEHGLSGVPGNIFCVHIASRLIFRLMKLVLLSLFLR